MPVTAFDILHYRDALKQELQIVLYFSDAAQSILLVPMCQLPNGMYYEQESITTLPLQSAPTDLGQLVKVHLLQFRQQTIDARQLRESEWPAYRASQVRSLKAFKSQFTAIRVQTINANFQIEAFPIGSQQIYVGAYIAPGCRDADLGQLLLRVYACCQTLAQANTV